MSDLINDKLDLIIALLKAHPGTKMSTSIADDADLDSKYGDEEIRKMPNQKYWTGEDYTGSRMSSCPADFLRAFAKYKDACAYMTRKNGDPEKLKYADYDEKSARRARGWAARDNAKAKPAKPVPSDLHDDGTGAESELPF